MIRGRAVVVLAAGLTALMAGCSAGRSPAVAPPTNSPSTASASTSSATAPQTDPAASVPVRSTLPQAMPALPDPVFTPGATNPQVSQAALRQTICTTGWTASVRPPDAYTEQVKRLEAGAGGTVTYAGVTFRVHGFELSDRSLGHYELDHLIPLELGGAPADPRNLWMENRREFPGAGEKDQLEDYLHRQVCSGEMTLVAAQKAIVTDWVTAYCAARLSECSDGVHLVQAAARPGVSVGG